MQFFYFFISIAIKTQIFTLFLLIYTVASTYARDLIYYTRTHAQSTKRKSNHAVWLLFLKNFVFRCLSIRLFSETSLCTKLAIQNTLANTQGFRGNFQQLVVGNKLQALFQAHFADRYQR